MRTLFFIIALLCSSLGSQSAVAREDAMVIAEIENSVDGEIARKVLKMAYGELGVPVEFRAFSADEALKQSNTGQVDAELQRIHGISEDFENLVQIPIPINVLHGSAYSIKYRLPITGWHSLRPYRIGVARGIVFSERYTRHMEVVTADGYLDLFPLLHAGEVDVVVLPRLVARHYLMESNDSTVQEMEGVLETLFLYHYVHRSRADVAERLTPILKKMLLNGESARIRSETIESMGLEP